MTLAIGVDFGQQKDRTAIVSVAGRRPDDADEGEEEDAGQRHRRRQRHYDVARIETLRPGVPYPAQVAQIVNVAESAADKGPELWCDQTGLGRPLLDLLREECRFPVHGVTSSGGSEVVRHGRDLTVAKALLVQGLEAVLSTRRLHCPDNLPGAPELRKQLAGFSYELTATGRSTYEGKGSADDTVSALCLAVFGLERRGGFGSGASFVEAVDQGQSDRAREQARKRRLARHQEAV